MGASSSSTLVITSSIPRTLLLHEDVRIWITEARSDKSKVEAALVEIKKIRSEMLNKKIDIGESRLSRLHRVEKENAELLNRLSSLASDRMRDQNAKIADLSDPNRPTKLAKLFSELYDIEWRDSLTSLKKRHNHNDRTAIEILLFILKNCYTKCQMIAQKQREELGETFFRKDERKGQSFELRINECQKQIAEITYKDLQQNCENFIEDSSAPKEDKTRRNQEYLNSEPVQNYCKLCIELTWLMCIQDPPIKLEFNAKEPISNYFRHYTRTGDEFDFMVWPVLFLHDNGPVLSKGVIQFKIVDDHSDRLHQRSRSLTSFIKMGASTSSTSVITTSIPRTLLLNEDVRIWITEARSDKSKVEAALVEIKKIRSEMLNKKIDIGESRLSRLHRVEKEKAELLDRLASDRMRNQNAKIADLSDTNRPTKLTERFSELYDNEWTDAFTSLRNEHNPDDRTAVDTLLLILKNCYTKCQTIAQEQRIDLGETFFRKDERKGQSFELRINECQKQIAEITYKDLQQNCENLIEDSAGRKEDKERNRECLKLEPVENYCKLCIELIWLMCIQAPPMKLEFIPKMEAISSHFRHYTRSGDKLDFLVWPVLFLHDKGPVLSKGVIQFKGSGKSDQKSANVNSKDKTKFAASPETMSEINSENGSQETRKQTNDATESNVVENQSQGTIENTKHVDPKKNLDF